MLGKSSYSFKNSTRTMSFKSLSSATYSELDSVLGVLVLDDGPHLEAAFEGTGDVVGRLAGLDGALDAGADLLLAQGADQAPSALL